jgi:hypothetical protein
MNSSLIIKAIEPDLSSNGRMFIGGCPKKNDYLEHLDLDVKKCKFKSNKISGENSVLILMSIDE